VNSPALQLSGVSFGYTTEPVLTALDLEIPSGGITALLGPNGCGKTTLLKLMLGLLRPDSGEIRVLGDPLDPRQRRSLSRRMGLIPQEEHVPFDLTLIEYVVLGRAPYLHLLQLPRPEDRDVAHQALRDVGLWRLAQRPVPSLSGGERQLAAVARALAQQPRILLADEPTSHLDLRNRRAVLDVLADQARSGRTVLMTTHDPNAAAAVAQQVVALQRGAVAAAGAPAEVICSETLSQVYGVHIDVELIRGRPTVLD
jgi:iron complex transport system ATP-binding protein